MPEISRFYGIVIRMFYEDHLPAHFYAEYRDFEWTTIHHEELIGIWDDIHNFKPAGKIAPLP